MLRKNFRVLLRWAHHTLHQNLKISPLRSVAKPLSACPSPIRYVGFYALAQLDHNEISGESGKSEITRRLTARVDLASVPVQCEREGCGQQIRGGGRAGAGGSDLVSAKSLANEMAQYGFRRSFFGPSSAGEMQASS